MNKLNKLSCREFLNEFYSFGTGVTDPVVLIIFIC